jgi:hypothetical protein
MGTTKLQGRKTEAGDRKVQHDVLKLRRARRLDYDWIADSTPRIRKPDSHGSAREAVEKVIRFYRERLWDEISDAVEVWCEKDALAGVILEVTAEYDVPLMVLHNG